jgi:hypothetical protein
MQSGPWPRQRCCGKDQQCKLGNNQGRCILYVPQHITPELQGALRSPHAPVTVALRQQDTLYSPHPTRYYISPHITNQLQNFPKNPQAHAIAAAAGCQQPTMKYCRLLLTSTVQFRCSSMARHRVSCLKQVCLVLQEPLPPCCVPIPQYAGASMHALRVQEGLPLVSRPNGILQLSLYVSFAVDGRGLLQQR